MAEAEAQAACVLGMPHFGDITAPLQLQLGIIFLQFFYTNESEF